MNWRIWFAVLAAIIIGLIAGLSCAGCAVETRTTTGDITLLRLTVNVHPTTRPVTPCQTEN